MWNLNETWNDTNFDKLFKGFSTLLTNEFYDIKCLAANDEYLYVCASFVTRFAQKYDNIIGRVSLKEFNKIDILQQTESYDCPKILKLTANKLYAYYGNLTYNYILEVFEITPTGIKKVSYIVCKNADSGIQCFDAYDNSWVYLMQENRLCIHKNRGSEILVKIPDVVESIVMNREYIIAATRNGVYSVHY